MKHVTTIATTKPDTHCLKWKRILSEVNLRAFLKTKDTTEKSLIFVALCYFAFTNMCINVRVWCGCGGLMAILSLQVYQLRRNWTIPHGSDDPNIGDKYSDYIEQVTERHTWRTWIHSQSYYQRVIVTDDTTRLLYEINPSKCEFDFSRSLK